MHARYYSFHTARFLSVDPVKGEVGSSQSWNRYGYVQNQTLRRVDSTGTYGEDVHLYYMYYLARMVCGFSEQDARRLAIANQLVDVKTPAAKLFRSGNWKKHFSGNPEAAIRFHSASGLEAQGAALHTVMDSYSHKGFYPWPIGHLIPSVLGRSPDEPWRRPRAFRDMSTQVVSLLGGDPEKIPDEVMTGMLDRENKEGRVAFLRSLGVPDLGRSVMQRKPANIYRVNGNVVRVNGELKFVVER